MILFLIIILAVVTVVAFLFFTFPIVQVVGNSMHPTYRDGELMLSTKLFRVKSIRAGDVIVYRPPTDENRWVVKRVAQIVEYKVQRPLTRTAKYRREFYCIGDNSDESYDSRDYGYVPQENIVCIIFNQRQKEEVDEDDREETA